MEQHARVNLNPGVYGKMVCGILSDGCMWGGVCVVHLTGANHKQAPPSHSKLRRDAKTLSHYWPLPPGTDDAVVEGASAPELEGAGASEPGGAAACGVGCAVEGGPACAAAGGAATAPASAGAIAAVGAGAGAGGGRGAATAPSASMDSSARWRAASAPGCFSLKCNTRGMPSWCCSTHAHMRGGGGPGTG